MRLWVCGFVALVFASLAASAAPVEFEPINPHLRLAIEPSNDGIKRAFQSLSLSADGAYVAFAGLDGKVDIWSVGEGGGAKTQLAWREDRLALVAVLGKPCVAVTAVSERLDSKTPSPGATERPLELWSCASGERIGEIRLPDAQKPNGLVDLVAVPACGLVVASYTDRIVVVDIASRAAVPQLSRVFDSAREAAIRTYPASARKDGGLAAHLRLAANPVVDRCSVYAAVQAYSERARDFLPTQIYDVDLRAGRSLLASELRYDAQAIEGSWSYPIAFALSPSGRYAAVFVRRPVDLALPMSGPRGVADLLLVDLKGDEAVKALDMRHLVRGIVDVAFLTDDVLFFTTTAMAQSTTPMLFDRRTGRLHTVCSSNFGERDPLKGNPRAMAVNAKLNLIALSLRDEVRLFRYRLNPEEQWVNMRKSCVPS
jgi:hypothetical protein